ncbi:MAG: hypothetical protein H0T05_05780 [Acidobacteria bacterium]|nr:hypothetical protein [Acidobacteriota bacterium]MBA3884299.1 hypothetical protein [Acidobacteriota bacterium]
MRFSRDKRGYEHTFVVHGERRRGRSHSRVLYWFRTPPGVRVGRAPLDADAIRLIEEHNPNLEFDWPRILKGDGAPADAMSRSEPAERRPRQDRPRSDRTPAAPRIPAVSQPPERPAQQDAPREAIAEEVTPSPMVLAEPEPEPAPDTPAGARLGAEGLGRLRARYAEVIARILEKVEDPEGQTELKSRAERLNPDTWVTDGEVTEGLEQYETVYEALRAVVGRRRTRRTR